MPTHHTAQKEMPAHRSDWEYSVPYIMVSLLVILLWIVSIGMDDFNNGRYSTK